MGVVVDGPGRVVRLQDVVELLVEVGLEGSKLPSHLGNGAEKPRQLGRAEHKERDGQNDEEVAGRGG